MLRYSLKRLAQSMVTLFIIITVVFLLLRLMPEEGYFGQAYEKLDEAQREAILTSMGLRDPIHIQLLKFYKSILSGDLGTSMIYRPKVPIAEILRAKIPYSLYFGLTAVLISLVAGVSLGIIMAKSKSKIWDKLGTGYSIHKCSSCCSILLIYSALFDRYFQNTYAV